MLSKFKMNINLIIKFIRNLNKNYLFLKEINKDLKNILFSKCFKIFIEISLKKAKFCKIWYKKKIFNKKILQNFSFKNEIFFKN